jgi:glycosyltransferase involved in cell wall biosynthesis
MKVLHVIPSISLNDGGPSLALQLMARGLREAGVEVHIATTAPEGESAPAASDDERLYQFPRQTTFYKVSRPLASWLQRHVRHYDLVHIHALFSYASYAASSQARREHIPYIVRPLGVLNRWGILNRRRLLKQISFRMIESRILRHAAAVQFTSLQEMREAQELGAIGRAVIIPLGIELRHFRELPESSLFYRLFPKADGREAILFLSRIDRKKGLDLLLPAFAEVHRRDPSTLLVIAGDGDEKLISELKQTAVGLGISKEVLWAGFLNGQEKLAALSAASLFVLPSYSENFGIAAVEALAAGVPSVLSDQVAIASKVSKYEAGFVSRCRVSDLSEVLSNAIADSEMRRTMSLNAKRLAEDCYSLEAMTESLVRLYRQVIVEGSALWKEAIAPRVSARTE